MIERRDRAGFTLEPFAHLRAGRHRLLDDLQRDQTIQTRVARFVHLAHPAGANGGQDFVRTEASTGDNDMGAASIPGGGGSLQG